jgi:hypothetical protein
MENSLEKFKQYSLILLMSIMLLSLVYDMHSGRAQSICEEAIKRSLDLPPTYNSYGGNKIF